MFGAVAACRDKHRLQPCEPKPRHAEARRIYKSPFLTGLAPRASARKQHSADRSRACELTMYALSERTDAACRGEPGDSRSDDPPCRKAAARATLRIVKLSKTGGKQPQPNNDFLLILPRHYTASGLLNLPAALAQAVACTTPGTPTAFRGKPYGRTNYRR